MELLSVHEDDCDDNVDLQSTETTELNETHSFMPFPVNETTEDQAIRSILDGSEHTDWPDIEQTPINEFQTPFLATMSFPTLFPYGRGDPTYAGRERSVSLADALKHLIKYAKKSSDNQWHWCFANHPRFPYWGLNMKQRHQLLSQANIYLQQHPEDANLTIEEMKSMIGQLSAEQLMNRLQRYAAKIQGSSQYWFQHYLELRALLEQKGSPTFFWTVSAADCH